MQRLCLLALFLFFYGISISAQDSSSAENCIVLMGDSLPAGTLVAELPGTGVAVLQSERISNLLHDALQSEQLLHYGIYDLSLPASAISDPNAEPYLTSREFFLGRGLNCRYIVIFPFLNDLYTSDDGETGIVLYQTGLTRMLALIREHSPDSHIILSNFYTATLQGVGNLTYGDDVTSEHVANMNAVHSTFCEDDLWLTCLALEALLAPIEDYVLGRISRDDYNAMFQVLNLDDQDMVARYWANTPNNPIRGDGLHLNHAGKSALVEALMQTFIELDPLNFAPIIAP